MIAMTQKADIQRKATELLSTMELEEVFPLPIEKVAEYLGFICHFYIPDEDIKDVTSAVNHLKKKIYVNQTNPVELQRFSIAERIGNLVLHGSNRDYIGEQMPHPEDPNIKEVECFAENLLMPETIFRSKWQREHADVELLASYFGVSHDRIKQRARALEII